MDATGDIYDYVALSNILFFIRLWDYEMCLDCGLWCEIGSKTQVESHHF